MLLELEEAALIPSTSECLVFIFLQNEANKAISKFILVLHL